MDQRLVPKEEDASSVRMRRTSRRSDKWARIALTYAISGCPTKEGIEAACKKAGDLFMR